MAKDSSQYKTAYGTYLGEYGQPRNPAFFGPELDEVEARLRQREQSLYGGFTTQLREDLASAGLLASGALPSALTQAQINLGQSTLGGISGLYQEELGRKRQFDISRALMLLEQDYDKSKQDDAQKESWKQALAQVGGILATGGMAALFPPAAPAVAGATIGAGSAPAPGFWGIPSNDPFTPTSTGVPLYDQRTERLFRTGSY